MESKHTPGPWTLAYHSDLKTPTGGIASIANGKKVGTFYMPYNNQELEFTLEAQANARLIAAAPDLLEALNCARTALRGATGNYDLTALHVIEHAIAKAQGK